MTISSQPRAIPRVHEAFGQTLRRNAAIAVTVGLAIALSRRNLNLALPSALLALWFSLGGHYVELLFLNGLRPRLPEGIFTFVVARLAVWFVGGAVLTVMMIATARLLSLRWQNFGALWLGALAFIGAELIVHSLLAARRLPNFFNRNG